jgi:Trk K+ transport system NAD-binding subunit
VVWTEGQRESVDYLELPDGHRVEVVAPPPWLVGRVPDVGELRARFGVTLVAVRRDEGGEGLPRWHDPAPDLRLRVDDRLMVIATEAELARLRSDPGPA